MLLKSTEAAGGQLQSVPSTEEWLSKESREREKELKRVSGSPAMQSLWSLDSTAGGMHPIMITVISKWLTLKKLEHVRRWSCGIRLSFQLN